MIMESHHQSNGISARVYWNDRCCKSAWYVLVSIQLAVLKLYTARSCAWRELESASYGSELDRDTNNV